MLRKGFVDLMNKSGCPTAGARVRRDLVGEGNGGRFGTRSSSKRGHGAHQARHHGRDRGLGAFFDDRCIQLNHQTTWISVTSAFETVFDWPEG